MTLRYEEPHDELAGIGSSTAHASDAQQARAVLHDIDLDVPAGRTVALVGATGSGKTSLVALISRLYDPSRGKRAAGRSRRPRGGPALAALRGGGRQRRPVPVLRLGRREHRLRPSRGLDREEIEAAARRAQAHEFVSRLPQGYETQIGERGLTVSGGQRQRIAIARALLADPRVLMLDDATSSVDASTEQQIKLALAEAMAGRTTFMIAHRLSTIALADEIVVLEGGRIAAQGNHEELLEESELYREIVEKGLPEQRVPDERDTRARTGGGAVSPGGFGGGRGGMGGGRGGGGGRMASPASGVAARSGTASAPARKAARATCAACWSCCAPTACASPRCSRRWSSAPPPRWRRRCWRRWRSTKGSSTTTHTRSCWSCSRSCSPRWWCGR